MKQFLILLTLLAYLPLFAHAQAPAEKPNEVQLKQLIDKLQTASTEERPALLKQLTALIQERIVTPIRLETMPAITVALGALGSSESMSGNWVGNQGEKGTYTLKSLGSGRYKLQARITANDGTKSDIKDEGKMPGLQKKYRFLAKWAFVATDVDIFTYPGRRFRVATAPPSTVKVSKLGLTLRRPSLDLEYHLKLAAETSWIVATVTPGSRGEKLGLKRHDLLVGADADDLADLATLRNATKSLTVVRRAKAKPARVSLIE